MPINKTKRKAEYVLILISTQGERGVKREMLENSKLEKDCMDLN